ncbi:helix-turn-helix domain-containing protein [Rhodobacter capsulatus]|uniref:helix-turn-helix domain-containing protein n=1 Tax=Rhodobacter capsulatus TaxID=1061 RepID=UPI00114336B0|nr:helix-turn-helix transcriptional regulator [Rhodobacter capsulatus]TQD37437.1 transcriptional regulator [Rhodobacter capsulatus]
MSKIWTKAQIKCALEEKGMTLSGLAILNDMNPSQMRSVWSRPVRPAEKVLAEFLGVPPAELFPTRYPMRKSSLLSAENEALIARKKAGLDPDKGVAA